jgi:hypothetical protein
MRSGDSKRKPAESPERVTTGKRATATFRRKGDDMKRLVWKMGLISGVILAAMVAAMVPACMNGKADFENAEIVGYTSMVLAFALVFFGIRSYRESQGGAISFGKAFQVGILIVLVACAFYVTAWEIVYWGFIPDFDQKYAEFYLAKLQRDGVSPEKLTAERAKMAQFQVMYKNPLYNAGITFMEVFPVGLVVTLVSAAILRKKPAPPLLPQAA